MLCFVVQRICYVFSIIEHGLHVTLRNTFLGKQVSQWYSDDLLSKGKGMLIDKAVALI